jgi:tetratricopeptide (TPR) repeat protein
LSEKTLRNPEEKLMNNQQSLKQNQPRLIRVFISSTFHDMQEERDELLKFIFPQLRKLCEQRGVTWGEVDLRWGITEAEAEQGKVLTICLDEIHRCRPYFIGMLGERYGWIPDEIPAEMVEREPWLANHIDHSVTELEILHGVLNNPEMAEHAFFYFRDRKYLEKIPPDERDDYLESDSSQNKQKLTDLKDRIKSSGFTVHEDYPNPKEFGQLVLQDMTTVIDGLFPEGSQPDPLDREAAEHEIFAQSRAQTYIGRQSYYDQIDSYTHSDSEPLVVLGESGSGKSALLANWAIQYRKEHPEELVLMHFIGATPDSADWASMLRRILGEFKRKYHFQELIPDQTDALRSVFANWLNLASARGRVVLILDALNQLDDRGGAPDLVWLPLHVPKNVRMLLSTLPGRPLEELKKRGWPVLTIEPLQVEERKQLIKKYLALFAKSLDTAPTERIAEAGQCQNPLFLRVLLNEIRLFGIHERLGSQIELYIKAATIPDLYELILKRCEQDYERERPGLVRDVMSMLWAARRGLSEVELKELLGSEGKPMPMAYWSPLSLALEQSLLNRSGLIDFAHDYLRKAAENLYLPEIIMQQQSHLRLADYFEARPGESPRRMDELPWQLAAAWEMQRLYTLLGNLEFFADAWEFDHVEVKRLWAEVEHFSPYRMLDAYQKVINDPDQYNKHVWCIASLLELTGHLEEAFPLRTFLVEHSRQAGDQANLQASIFNMATILQTRGDLGGALALYKEQERICRKVVKAKAEVKADLLASLGNKFAARMEAMMSGDMMGEEAGLSASLRNQGLILEARGDLEGSIALIKESERIEREMGNKAGLLETLVNKGSILHDHGDLEGAMALFMEGERIGRELGDKEGLSASLSNQAEILKARGDLVGAMALYQELQRICSEMGNQTEVMGFMLKQAGLISLMLHQVTTPGQPGKKNKKIGFVRRLVNDVKRLFVKRRVF